MSKAQSRPSIALMYHRVGNSSGRSIVPGQYVRPSILRHQLRSLIGRGYRPITLRDMLAREAYDDHFAATFDDGYAGVGELAYPVLAELQAPATIFVVAGMVGKTNEWDERIGDCTERLLDKAQLCELAAAGFEIASHTVNHVGLANRSPQELLLEVCDARSMLEDLIGQPVVGIAYPYGRWDAAAREAVIEAGYQYAVTTVRGALTPGGDPYAIPRINMRRNTFSPMLWFKIRKAYKKMAEETAAVSG